MVVGSGMIAKRFSNYAENKEVIIFASGVSNSSTHDADAFKREADLLAETTSRNPDSTLVYFSTCSIYDPSLQASAYVLHKLAMEAFIKQGATSYLIFRVSNPVGFTHNKHTVLNYFIEHISQQQAFILWEYASRNIIDIDDMYRLCQYFISDSKYCNQIINIANPVNYPVLNIVEAIEKHIGIKGYYAIAAKGSSPLIDTSSIQPFFSKLGIEFHKDYFEQLLAKYFPEP